MGKKSAKKKAKRYSSNAIALAAKNNVSSLFTKYYSWLTNSVNLYNSTVGAVVKQFCLFGLSEVDPHEPKSKDLYIKSLETIAEGIIKTSSKSDSLDVFDYINYQTTALETLFKTKDYIRDEKMIEIYKTLFFIQDLDNDGRLNIQDLAVSIAYLDLKDGKLTGKFNYEDVISLDDDLATDEGRFKMRVNLDNLKKFLYGN